MILVRLLGVLVFIIVLTNIFVPVVHSIKNSQETDADKHHPLFAYLITNQQVLSPEWFKKRYRLFYWEKPSEKVVQNALESNILLLGLFLYPVLSFIILRRGDAGSWFRFFSYAYLYPYNGIFIVSILISIISGLVIGFFSDTGSFVPSDFISFSLHAFLQCGLIIVCLTMLANWVAGRQIVAIPTNNPTPSRVRWVLASMLKAAIVTILTGIATTIGGWIGGGIIFVITTGIAAAFGINLAHAQEAK